MNQVEVQIMGQSYRLGCPENGAERLQAAVLKVDAAMCAIRDAGKVKARDRIAVLAALNLAFDLSERETAEAIAAAPVATPVEVPAAANVPTAEPAALAASTTSTTSATSPEDANAQLSALLARLDDALGDDGRLI